MTNAFGHIADLWFCEYGFLGLLRPDFPETQSWLVPFRYLYRLLLNDTVMLL